MPVQRALTAGATNYSGASLDDVLDHIADWQRMTDEQIAVLAGIRSRFEETAYRMDAAGSVRDYIEKYLDLFGRFSSDFARLLTELPRGVRDAHVELVHDMYERSQAADADCYRFAERHINRALRHEPILDVIYQTTREQTVDYMDLSNVAARLATFVDVEQPRRFSVNEAIEAKPNIAGMGLNLNYIFQWLRTKLGK